MHGSRHLIYAVLGWDTAAVRPLEAAFVNEYPKQVIVYCGFAVAFALLNSIERYRQEQLRNAELERRLTEAQLDRLKMQLNPHFLFNTLNLVACMVREDPDKAECILGELGDFLRMTLRHAQKQQVPLSEDLNFLAAYLSIMKARFGPRLAIDLDIAADAQQGLVPHLMLQPLVENAIKHSSASGEAAHVQVNISRQQASLTIEIEDNGPGPDAPNGTLVFGTGVGLSSTRERLIALYGDAHQLELTARKEGGARLRVQLPYQTQPVKRAKTGGTASPDRAPGPQYST